MNLSLAFPSQWEVKHTADGRVAAILPSPTGDAMPDLVLTYGPLIVKPDEPRLWADQTARADLPRGANVKIGKVVDQTTRDGWAMRLLEADVIADNQLVEVRLCAMYTFLEHAVAVTARAGSRERLQARNADLLELFSTGRPDWRSHPLCLVDAWDLERPRFEERTQVSRAARPDFFEQEVARIEAIATPTANDHLHRGVALLALSRPDDALVAARASLAIAPSEAAHYLAGTALGTLGKHREAIAEWTAALVISARVDTHYNIGQAHYTLGEFEDALSSFRAAHALDPSDVMLERKIVQCLYALGRIDEGVDARAQLRRRWTTSRDPRVRTQIEYVFDQFEGPGFRIHAIEPLLQRDPALTTLMTFRAVNDKDQSLGAEVLVETSEQAKRAGTPFVIGVKARGQFKVAATLPTLQPYPTLREQARDLLTQLVKPPTPPS